VLVYRFWVTTITRKELRNNVDVLRRAEPGEEFTVTVAGRPVARLGPIGRDQWVVGAKLQRVWQTPAPETLAKDLERLPAEIVDVSGAT
jgi:prevent-host-death family protein